MRKTVTNLTNIRHDVYNTAWELHESSIDLEATLGKISSMTPEQVRQCKAKEHNDLLKQVSRLNANIRRITTRYNLAVERLQTFF